jgi:hypothetical protein
MPARIVRRRSPKSTVSRASFADFGTSSTDTMVPTRTSTLLEVRDGDGGP